MYTCYCSFSRRILKTNLEALLRKKKKNIKFIETITVHFFETSCCLSHSIKLQKNVQNMQLLALVVFRLDYIKKLNSYLVIFLRNLLSYLIVTFSHKLKFLTKNRPRTNLFGHPTATHIKCIHAWSMPFFSSLEKKNEIFN